MNIGVLIIGIVMASIDSIVLPMINTIHKNNYDMYFMAIPMIIYAMQPLLFKKSLEYGKVAQMNIIWDVLSDIFVTVIAIVFLQEIYSFSQIVGIVFGIISVALLS
jgi:uncharacterized membrane protein